LSNKSVKEAVKLSVGIIYFMHDVMCDFNYRALLATLHALFGVKNFN